MTARVYNIQHTYVKEIFEKRKNPVIQGFSDCHFLLHCKIRDSILFRLMIIYSGLLYFACPQFFS